MASMRYGLAFIRFRFQMTHFSMHLVKARCCRDIRPNTGILSLGVSMGTVLFDTDVSIGTYQFDS